MRIIFYKTLYFDPYNIPHYAKMSESFDKKITKIIKSYNRHSEDMAQARKHHERLLWAPDHFPSFEEADCYFHTQGRYLFRMGEGYFRKSMIIERALLAEIEERFCLPEIIKLPVNANFKGDLIKDHFIILFFPINYYFNAVFEEMIFHKKITTDYLTKKYRKYNSRWNPAKWQLKEYQITDYQSYKEMGINEDRSGLVYIGSPIYIRIKTEQEDYDLMLFDKGINSQFRLSNELRQFLIEKKAIPDEPRHKYIHRILFKKSIK